jgi:DNA-directed RNA polymerase subunit RPC12/RpoP
MILENRLAAVRARRDAELTYLCLECQVELTDFGSSVGVFDPEKYVLKCPTCGTLVGEWPTMEEKQAELRDWFCRHSPTAA